MLKRGLLIALMGLTLLAPMAAVQAATLPPAPVNTQALQTQALTLMENHWLGMTFEGDPPTKRLARIESLLFGEPATKSQPNLTEAQRLKALIQYYEKTLPPPPPPPAEEAQPYTPYTGVTNLSDTLSRLEIATLKEAFPTDTTPIRLVRLEALLLGKPQPTNVPEAQRVAALVQRANERGYNLNATLPPVDTTPAPPAYEVLSDAQTLETRVRVLENIVLQSTAYGNQPLEGRVSRLEMALLSAEAPADVTLPQRVERLEALATTRQTTPAQRQAARTGQVAKTAIPFVLILLLMLL
jgi:hypothetical protein